MVKKALRFLVYSLCFIHAPCFPMQFKHFARKGYTFPAYNLFFCDHKKGYMIVLVGAKKINAEKLPKRLTQRNFTFLYESETYTCLSTDLFTDGLLYYIRDLEAASVCRRTEVHLIDPA